MIELTLLINPKFNSVKTAKWVGDCFVYTNGANRLNYLVGTQPQTVNHFDTWVLLFSLIAADANGIAGQCIL